MRKSDIDNRDLLRMHKEGKSLAEIGKVHGISKVAVHKRIKRMLTNTNTLQPSSQPVTLTKLNISEVPTQETKNQRVNDQLQKPIDSTDPGIPQYLRKIDTGEIFIATKFLLERKDMVPYYGPLPWEEKPETQPEEIKRAIPFTVAVEESAKPVPESQSPGEVNPPKPDIERFTKDHFGSAVNPSEMLTNVDVNSVPGGDVNLTKLNIEKIILDLRSQGKSLSFIGKILGISKVAVHKRLKRLSTRREVAC